MVVVCARETMAQSRQAGMCDRCQNKRYKQALDRAAYTIVMKLAVAVAVSKIITVSKIILQRARRFVQCRHRSQSDAMAQLKKAMAEFKCVIGDVTLFSHIQTPPSLHDSSVEIVQPVSRALDSRLRFTLITT